MNAEFVTPDLSDLNVTFGTLTSDEMINVGDTVVFTNDATGLEELGVYLDLYPYTQRSKILEDAQFVRKQKPVNRKQLFQAFRNRWDNISTSPWHNDNRVMAYVANMSGGTDYTDCTTVRKVASIVLETVKLNA